MVMNVVEVSEWSFVYGSGFRVDIHMHTSPIHIHTFPCVSQTNTLELLVHLQQLIPCPNLPTINPVNERSLLITVLLIITGFDHQKIRTVDKHPDVVISG